MSGPSPTLRRRVRAQLRPIRRRLGLRYVIDRDADYRRTVFLAGTARSGTTWLSELINHRNEYRYIFEPFNPRHVPIAERFGPRRYLRPGERDCDLVETAHRILSGQVRSSWTERFNRRIIAHRRLTKSVRANLFLAWLQELFPGMPIVLALRHPCAVALSHTQRDYGDVLDVLLAQESLVEDFLAPVRVEMRRARDRFERAVFVWCVETLVALRQSRRNAVHLVFYEHLARDPAGEIRRLFSFLGRDYDASILDRASRPSLTARRDSAVSVGADPVEAWRAAVRPEQRRRTLEILRRFGLDGIYSDDPLPDPRAAAALMAREARPG